MSALTENLLNMFLLLGILVYMLDLVTSFIFTSDEEEEDEDGH